MRYFIVVAAIFILPVSSQAADYTWDTPTKVNGLSRDGGSSTMVGLMSDGSALEITSGKLYKHLPQGDDFDNGTLVTTETNVASMALLSDIEAIVSDASLDIRMATWDGDEWIWGEHIWTGVEDVVDVNYCATNGWLYATTSGGDLYGGLPSGNPQSISLGRYINSAGIDRTGTYLLASGSLSGSSGFYSYTGEYATWGNEQPVHVLDSGDYEMYAYIGVHGGYNTVFFSRGWDIYKSTDGVAELKSESLGVIKAAFK
jgi:hypothetical protein